MHCAAYRAGVPALKILSSPGIHVSQPRGGSGRPGKNFEYKIFVRLLRLDKIFHGNYCIFMFAGFARVFLSLSLRRCRVSRPLFVRAAVALCRFVAVGSPPLAGWPLRLVRSSRLVRRRRLVSSRRALAA